MDMSIGEFDEVGNIVRGIASEEAVIVMGTAIDPEMKDQMRVTVVATGLGEPSQKLKVVERKQERPAQQIKQVVNGAAIETMEVAESNAQTEVVKPATQPRRPVGELAPVTDNDMEYLDIPAFLRRQAD
jgi:cell division protein FtsZ